MAAVSHGARHLRRGIGVPRFSSSATQHAVAHTRSFFSRLLSHLSPTPQPALARPAQPSNFQSINARFSLPVRHALSRPFSPPRLPRPPPVPANVTHLGLGSARAFHSGRPIFQNMIDNVPIATRALWEAEWDVKLKKKEARRLRRPTKNHAAPKSHQLLKPNPKSLIDELQSQTSSEIDVYFPLQPASAVTTHLLVPLAPTPTARLPLSTRSDSSGAHPLLPISDLAHIHTSHRLHSLRVSTLFARLDAADVWDDPGISVDAYGFGPPHHTGEKQCTVLRVTFRGWSASRVRLILGDTVDEWCSLREIRSNQHPASPPFPSIQHDALSSMRSESPFSEGVGLGCASDISVDDEDDVLFPSSIRASANAQHDLIFPSLDLSSVSPDAANNLPPSQPVMYLRTVSELIHDAEQSSLPSASSSTDGSWESLCLSSSFLKQIGESHQREAAERM